MNAQEADAIGRIAWRYWLVALRYQDAEPGTVEAIVGDIYDRHASALINLPGVSKLLLGDAL